MFDRAFIGLRNQGFKQAVVADENGMNRRCVYLNADGCRCAWGHVDKNLDGTIEATVPDLWRQRIGIAGRLTEEDMKWATLLQREHDKFYGTVPMEQRLRDFAAKFGLTVPE